VKRPSWFVLTTHIFYILEETRTPKGDGDSGDGSGGCGVIERERGALVP